MNSIIGGPHASFQFLAEKAGNTAALLTHFTEGLMELRQLGPPRIPECQWRGRSLLRPIMLLSTGISTSLQMMKSLRSLMERRRIFALLVCVNIHG
jgi:hypothetical protein